MFKKDALLRKANIKKIIISFTLNTLYIKTRKTALNVSVFVLFCLDQIVTHTTLWDIYIASLLQLNCIWVLLVKGPALRIDCLTLVLLVNGLLPVIAWVDELKSWICKICKTVRLAHDPSRFLELVRTNRRWSNGLDINRVASEKQVWKMLVWCTDIY